MQNALNQSPEIFKSVATRVTTKGTSSDVSMHCTEDSGTGIITKSFLLKLKALFESKYDSCKTSPSLTHINNNIHSDGVKLFNDTSSITVIEFKQLLMEANHSLSENEINHIIDRIDVSESNYITFKSFINFIIGCENSRAFTANYYMWKLNKVHDQDPLIDVHQVPIEYFCYCAKPRLTLISAGMDDTIHINDLSKTYDGSGRTKRIRHLPISTIYTKKMLESMNKVQKSQFFRLFGNKKVGSSGSSSENKFSIICMNALSLSPHICVGSSDSTLTLYEVNIREACGRIIDLDHLPTAISSYSQTVVLPRSDNINETMECHAQRIAFGDSDGNISIIKLSHEFSISLETSSKRKYQSLFESAVRNCDSYYIIKKIHKDWVTNIINIPELKSLVSCSTDLQICIMDYDMGANCTKYFVEHTKNNKLIVEFLSWSNVDRYIISGTVRELILWDPYTLEILYRFNTFTSTIIQVQMSDRLNRIVIAFSDKSIRMYDGTSYVSLGSVTDNTRYSPLDNLTCMVLIDEYQLLFTANNRICTWEMSEKSSNMGLILPSADTCSVTINTIGDLDDLVAAICNEALEIVILVTAIGVVKVYSVSSGKILIKFSVNHITDESSDNFENLLPNGLDSIVKKPCRFVTAATLDSSKKKLILTTVHDTIQTWNFNTGTCISCIKLGLKSHMIYPGSIRRVVHGSVLSCHSNSVGGNCIVCMLHDMRVYCAKEETYQARLEKGVILGLSSGAISYHKDAGRAFDHTPVAFLVRDLTSLPPIATGDATTDNRRVLWILRVSDIIIAASYADGPIILWNTCHGVKVGDIFVSDTGHILTGLPIKQSLSAYAEDFRSGNYVGTSTTSTILNTDDKPRLLLANSAVIYQYPNILICACNDQLIRMWDMSSYCTHDAAAVGRESSISRSSPLCSCKYWTAMGYDDDIIKTLTMNSHETIMAAGYVSGMICLWGVYPNALQALVTNSSSDNVNIDVKLLISPLHLISSWSAHSCCINSISFIGMQAPVSSSSSVASLKYQCEIEKSVIDEEFDVTSTFLVSAAVDQHAIAWLADGRCIGVLGQDTWKLGDLNVLAAKNLTIPIGIDSSNCSKPVSPKAPARTSKRTALRPVRLSPHDQRHTSLELNAYVEKMNLKSIGDAKIRKSEVGENHFNQINRFHPIADISFVDDLTSSLKKIRSNFR